jgi:hypothetical protein
VTANRSTCSSHDDSRPFNNASRGIHLGSHDLWFGDGRTLRYLLKRTRVSSNSSYAELCVYSLRNF